MLGERADSLEQWVCFSYHETRVYLRRGLTYLSCLIRSSNQQIGTRNTAQKSTYDQDFGFCPYITSGQINFKKISIEKSGGSALLACCLQKLLLCLRFYKCVPHVFINFFFEIRLTRGDVWAKTEVLVIGNFLCCILGSYLLYEVHFI